MEVRLLVLPYCTRRPRPSIAGRESIVRWDHHSFLSSLHSPIKQCLVLYFFTSFKRIMSLTENFFVSGAPLDAYLVCFDRNVNKEKRAARGTSYMVHGAGLTRQSRLHAALPSPSLFPLSSLLAGPLLMLMRLSLFFLSLSFSFGTTTNWFGTPTSTGAYSNCTCRPTTSGDQILYCITSE